MTTPLWAPPPQVNNQDEANLTRVQQQEQIAKTLGVAAQEPYYALGTKVNELGVENAQQYRQEFDELPSIQDACTNLQGVISAECRFSKVVDAGSLRLDAASGRLVNIETQKSALLTTTAFKHLFSRLDVPPYAAQFLLGLDSLPHRANVANHLFQKNKGRESVLWGKKPSDETTTRIYAVTSSKYAPYHPARLCRDIQRLLISKPELAAAKAEVKYDGEKTLFRLLANSDIKPENYVAGEFFRSVLAFSIDDVKNQSVQVWDEVWRNLCLNLILLDFNQRMLLRRRHIGSAQTISDQVRNTAFDNSERLVAFLQLWSEKRSIEVIEPEAVIGNLVGEDAKKKSVARIQLVGVSPEDLAKHVREAYIKEPENTQAGIVNAFTRAAHESFSPWQGESLQEQAAMLLAMPAQVFVKFEEV